MADVDIDPFGNHNITDSHPDITGENFPFTPGGESTREPECKQGTSFSFGELILRTGVFEYYVEELY